MAEFNNDLTTVKRKTYWFSKKTNLMVRIMNSQGRVETGIAIPCFEGFNIFCTHEILSTYGESGLFPHKSSWSWIRWEFIREGEEE